MFWSTRKIIISTGHGLHHPHYAHFYCYFSHRLGIERVKISCLPRVIFLFRTDQSELQSHHLNLMQQMRCSELI